MSKEGEKLCFIGGSIAPDMLVDPDFLTFSIFEDFTKSKEVVSDVEKVWYRLPDEDMSLARLIWQDKDSKIMKMASEANECGEVYIYMEHSVAPPNVVENVSSFVTAIGENEATEDCLDDGEKADDENGGDEENREEEENDDENRVESSEDEREEECHEEEREEEGGQEITRPEEEAQSKDENQILGEAGADDPRFANLFALAELETPTVHSKGTQPNVDVEAGYDSEVEGERVLPLSLTYLDAGGSNPYPPRKCRATKSQPIIPPSTPNQSQPSTAPQPSIRPQTEASSSTVPAFTAPQVSTGPQTEAGSSTAAAATGRRRGRPPGRGQACKVTVPRGIGVYMCPFSNRVFECFGFTSREVGGDSSKGPNSRK
ncbi:unnamed protein product [Thlaspi arvense]|uniref:PB1-like domain-containing protein n=1 Tax=Thlaspi arvense TaxID=13288 RepID=A0AAU9RR09_THLAR|nr:unnamed protein product [Thlaspi arvense]